MFFGGFGGASMSGGRVFVQRRHNGRRHRHQHYREEEDNDPVSKKPITYNFIVFTHVCYFKLLQWLQICIVLIAL